MLSNMVALFSTKIPKMCIVVDEVFGGKHAERNKNWPGKRDKNILDKSGGRLDYVILII